MRTSLSSFPDWSGVSNANRPYSDIFFLLCRHRMNNVWLPFKLHVLAVLKVVAEVFDKYICLWSQLPPEVSFVTIRACVFALWYPARSRPDRMIFQFSSSTELIMNWWKRHCLLSPTDLAAVLRPKFFCHVLFMQFFASWLSVWVIALWSR